MYQEAILVLADNTSLRIFVLDSESFIDKVNNSPSTAIDNVSIPTTCEINTKAGDIIQECQLTLADGTQLYCSMLERDIPEAVAVSNLVVACEEVFFTEMIRASTLETCLDNRMAAVALVVNNIPDKRRRLNLHKEYLKRKSAYIAALEAMINGEFATPDPIGPTTI